MNMMIDFQTWKTMICWRWQTSMKTISGRTVL